jgi:hypothetical protein
VGLLDEYLTLDPVVIGGGDFTRRSSFAAAITDARNVSGRDPLTGEVLRPEGTLAWIGAVAWLCFLDQVGVALTRTDISQGQSSRLADRHGRQEDSFRSGLVLFAGLDDDAIAALWALRCSLAHTYSLMNHHDRRSDLCHRFLLLSDRRFALVHRAAGQDVITIVNLWALGDLGESVRSSIEAANAAGTLRIRGDEQRFRERFFMKQGMGLELWSNDGPGSA